MPISALLALLNDPPWIVSLITRNIEYMHYTIGDQTDRGIGKE